MASGSLSRTLPGLIFAVLVGLSLTFTIAKHTREKSAAAAREAEAARQAAARAQEEARATDESRAKERPRIERGVVGHWVGRFGQHDDARISVAKEGKHFRAVLFCGGHRETFHGALLDDNQLKLDPIEVVRVGAGGSQSYAPDTVYLSLSPDGRSLNGTYSDTSRRTGSAYFQATGERWSLESGEVTTAMALTTPAPTTSAPAESVSASESSEPRTTAPVSGASPEVANASGATDDGSKVIQQPPEQTRVASANRLSSYVGTWRGSVKQWWAPAYNVVMSIHEGGIGAEIGSVEYPEVHCRGTLRLRELGDGYIRIDEQIDSGRCVNNGSIKLVTSGSGTAEYSWLDATGRSRASAHVFRGDDVARPSSPPPAGRVILGGTTIRTGTTITTGSTVRTGTQ